MDVPETVQTALADQPVAGRRCLEAGAGVGNASAGLLAAEASTVVAVTDDAAHARTVRDRISDDRLAVLEADLRSIPLPDDSVEFVTAHALFNLLEPAATSAVAVELTRVAAPGTRLLVDDYAPLNDEGVQDLFAVENALSQLTTGQPALTFYPAEHLRHLFEGLGWTFERERTLLAPVPWTAAHLEAHLDAVRRLAEEAPDRLASPLVDRAETVVASLESTDEGVMYSLAFRR